MSTQHEAAAQPAQALGQPGSMRGSRVHGQRVVQDAARGLARQVEITAATGPGDSSSAKRCTASRPSHSF